MSEIRLNDIWRKVNTEILFFTMETFNEVPPTAGVYAWFYPLRIITKDFDEFISEIETILNYDCESKGIPSRNLETNIGWDLFINNIEIRSKKMNFNNFKIIWDEFSEDEIKFNELRKIIMRSSIFLTPLYVGKARNLKTRCQQHINGTAKDNTFHNRFEEYATRTNSKAKRVSDLLFVTLKTEEKSGLSEKSGKSAQCDHLNPVELDHRNPEQTDQVNPVQIDHPISCN